MFRLSPFLKKALGGLQKDDMVPTKPAPLQCFNFNSFSPSF